jgi:chromosome segregation ATPase
MWHKHELTNALPIVTDLLSNLREWEQHEAATKTRHEQVLMKLQELDTLKREMNVQLERLREDKQLAEQSLEQLLDKYEEIRLQIAQYSVEHQNDIPLAKYVAFLSYQNKKRHCALISELVCMLLVILDTK